MGQDASFPAGGGAGEGSLPGFQDVSSQPAMSSLGRFREGEQVAGPLSVIWVANISLFPGADSTNKPCFQVDLPRCAKGGAIQSMTVTGSQML